MTTDLASLAAERSTLFSELATLNGREAELRRLQAARDAEARAGEIAAHAGDFVHGPMPNTDPPSPAAPDYEAERARITAKIADVDVALRAGVLAEFPRSVRRAEAAARRLRERLAVVGRAVLGPYGEVLDARSGVVAAGAALRELGGMVSGRDGVTQARLNAVRQHLRSLGAKPSEAEIIGSYVVALLDHLRRGGSSPVPGLAQRHGAAAGSLLLNGPILPDPLTVRDRLPIPELEA